MSNSLIIELQARGVRVRAVSFTGVASSLLTKGATIHSAFGFNPSDMHQSFSSLPDMSQMSFRDHWRDVKILIIDEISMVSPQLFYLMDQRLREITQLQSPFGGASALLIGDMHQIPPVRPPTTLYDVLLAVSGSGTYTFSPSFSAQYRTAGDLFAKFKKIELTKQLRAEKDPKHIEDIAYLRDITRKFPIRDDFFTYDCIQNL